jgi:hypothetical protein
MGHSENPTRPPEKQDVRGRRRRRPRMRQCLLKGCPQRFRPRQASQRFCGDRCRKAARGWARWKTQQRYRRTRSGREKRKVQNRRYRERVRSRKPPEPEAVGTSARVTTPELSCGDCCDRPGCYARYLRARRSPLQRFCSPACRRAVERVEQRERRWKSAGVKPEILIARRR